MKRMSASSLLTRKRGVPSRKAVVERTSEVKYRNKFAVPERKEKFVGGSNWCDADAGPSLMEMRQWTAMMARISHASYMFSKCVDIDPLVMSGIPVVSGTRMPVAMVLANVAAGMSLPDIADDLELDKQSLVSILRCLATAFDRPANEHYPARRMLELKESPEFVRPGGEDSCAAVPERLIWKVD